MLTILTPTYNRRHTLPHLYDSLYKQGRQDFEWLIVDDGSVDDTMSWVQGCQAQAEFPIRIERQENGGKHAAINAGVRAARGDWIFIVDSDDCLTPDAVECVADAVAEAVQAPESVVGVCFRKADMQGRLLGLPREREPSPWVATPSQAGRRVQGDLAYVFRRDVMADLPFPIIPGECFVPELYIWNQIGDRGPIWFYLDRAIYLCEYLDDGYTRNFRAHLRRNPGGFLLFYAAQIGREPHWKDRVKAAIRSLQCLVYCAMNAADRSRPTV
ncbi:glycosyltransferase family 2 protein [Castellaniella sp. MT123]|uniref:glycosyltransferase family 2 protein n=1 Tax=Castellaniella sp. MT123 TaxID=3140381 RepID=UPI0031F46FB2